MLALILINLSYFSIVNPKVNGSQQPTISKQKHIEESFLTPEVVHVDSYDWLKIDNCSYISEPGQPMLPQKCFVFKLPQGSQVTNLKVEVHESHLQGSFLVVPVPSPVIVGMETSSGNFSENPDIYQSSSIFPKDQYVSRQTHGLDPETMTRVEYFVVTLYPLRFLPVDREMIRVDSVSITVDYVETAALAPLSNLRNLIITSDALEPYAIQLAAYKNSTGISSRAANLTWVYKNYGGIDHPEQIRNCIKDFVAKYGIIYVTIFGDADQVPVRYAFVNDTQSGELNVPTDLYYGDLDGTWDDNNDGVYADVRFDKVDGIPDVYVGRIPASLASSAQTAIGKIEGYQEQFNASDSWTQRVVLAAGTGQETVYQIHLGLHSHT